MTAATSLKIASAYKGALIEAMRYYADGTFCDAPFAAYREEDGSYYVRDMLTGARVEVGLEAKAARAALRRLFAAAPVPAQARIVKTRRGLVVV